MTTEAKKLQTTLAQFDPSYWPFRDGPQGVHEFVGNLRHDAGLAHEMIPVLSAMAAGLRAFDTLADANLRGVSIQHDTLLQTRALIERALHSAAPFLQEKD